MTAQGQAAILFDLDGTLTDPFTGITRSIQYALEELGRVPPAADDLRWCIGPPLSSAFETLLETNDAARIARAVGLYRQRYADVGKFENRLIDGIPEALNALAAEAFAMVVATSKLGSYANEILDHFDLRQYFRALYGSQADGTHAHKPDLIAHILQCEAFDADRTIMIGDRSHDIAGAKANGVRSIGVLWGFGDRSEFKGAGADWIAETPGEIAQIVKAAMVPANSDCD